MSILNIHKKYYIKKYIEKMTTKIMRHNFLNFYVKCSELFLKIKKKLRIIEN